jgi:serine phosphatase RsbU (regulator of sigma subunit)
MNLINRISKLSKSTIIIITVLMTQVIGHLDYITGAEISISIFYVIPVALCAWFVHRKAGFALAFLSSITLYVADFLCSPSYSHPFIPIWNAIVSFGFFSIMVWSLSSYRKVMDRENTRALEIQHSMLPKNIPEFPGYDIAVAWRPTSRIGGDYYDIVNLADSTMGLCIGDVAGHGIPAALLMSNLQAAFRILAINTHSPDDLCDQLNKFIVNNTESENFISFFYSILETEKKVLHYSNAGHPPPFVLRQNGTIHRLSTDGLLLGVTDDFVNKHAILKLETGDVIILYTDGVVEARNPRGEFFGEEGLINVCKMHFHQSANDICENILRSLSLFNNNNNHDDVTLLVIVVN